MSFPVPLVALVETPTFSLYSNKKADILNLRVCEGPFSPTTRSLQSLSPEETPLALHLKNDAAQQLNASAGIQLVELLHRAHFHRLHHRPHITSTTEFRRIHERGVAVSDPCPTRFGGGGPGAKAPDQQFRELVWFWTLGSW